MLTLVGGPEALKEKETLAELFKGFEVHQMMIGKWKQAFLNRAASVFEKPFPVQGVGESGSVVRQNWQVGTGERVSKKA